jgi:hypothetical protein
MPTDRSISPLMSSSTMPVATIAMGAVAWAMLSRLLSVRKIDRLYSKYAIRANATIRTLASRRCRNVSRTSVKMRRRVGPGAGFGAGPGLSTGSTTWTSSLTVPAFRKSRPGLQERGL